MHEELDPVGRPWPALLPLERFAGIEALALLACQESSESGDGAVA